MAVVIGQGGGANIISNNREITSSITMSSGNNYGSFGPITINSGVTVTVNSGSSFTVL